MRVTIPKKTEKEENAEETYSSFIRTVKNLQNTTWTHWEQAVKELMKVIETSSIIQNAINKHAQSEYSFDIKKEIKTAVLHRKELFNRNITSNKSKEITFAYQLLLYLSKNRTVQLMKKLIGSYGKTEEYDDKTHPDEKIRNFFNNGAITNFIKMIDVHCETLIPKESREKILYNINNFNINGNNYGDIYQAENMLIDRDKEDDEAKAEKEKDDEKDFLN